MPRPLKVRVDEDVSQRPTQADHLQCGERSLLALARERDLKATVRLNRIFNILWFQTKEPKNSARRLGHWPTIALRVRGRY